MKHMVSRLLCLATVAGLAFASAAAIDADSYVRRGLVAQWDGIDNLATGTHVANTNVWVDRMGNSTDFTASYLSFEGGNCAYLAGRSISSTCSKLPTKYVASTLEAYGFASKYTGHQSTDGMVACGQGSALFWHNGTSKFGCTWIASTTVRNFAGTGNFSVKPQDVGNASTWTISQDGSFGFAVYINGTKGTFGKNNYYHDGVTASTQTISLGTGNDGVEFKISSVRMYTQSLSDAEVALNAAIDRVRFAGAELKDVLPATMPDGYRLNAAQDGFEVRVRAVVNDGSGTLSVDGGDPAASNEMWVVRGTAVEIAYAGDEGRVFGRWIGAPEGSAHPSDGVIRFVVDYPVSLTGEGGSADPVIDVYEPKQVLEGSFRLPYCVASAGSAADDVTLYVCYGQDPERLSNTNVYEHVIGEGEALVDGLIHSRTYYVKVVADGNGHVTEDGVRSVATRTGTAYGTYEAAQPVVRTVIASGLQESLRVCGDMTAPEGTKLVVRYGATADVETMTAVEFDWEEWHQAEGCRVFVDGVAPGAYSILVELRNGSYLDRYPTAVTATAVASTVEPAGTRRAAVLDGNCYLQTKRVPKGVFTGPFTMCIWVKNPRANVALGLDLYGLNRAGGIMRCGNSGASVPGPAIEMSPIGYSRDADAEFCADPKFVISASLRSSGNDSVSVASPDDLEIWRDDKWHFIALTWNPTVAAKRTLALYLDGKKVDEKVASRNFTEEPNFALTFGALQHSPGQGRLIGSLAEASVWKRALSAKEIRRLMHYTADPDDPSLAGYWLTSVAPYTADRSKVINPNDLVIGGGVKFESVRDLKIRPTGAALLVR